jgi:hypothetical protein
VYFIPYLEDGGLAGVVEAEHKQPSLLVRLQDRQRGMRYANNKDTDIHESKVPS